MQQKAIIDTMTADTAVSVSQVSKSYFQKQRPDTLRGVMRSMFSPEYLEIPALKNVSFQVPYGEIIAYAGPNGAGKSTTIKMLSGLMTPDEGQLRVLSMDPAKERILFMKKAGILFGQRTELWWDHPVSTSFDWKQTVWDIPKERYQRMRDTLVDLLDIGPFLYSHVRELSLGQRMRADLAMALLHEPELLFLDEPTIGLDVLAKRQTIQFLKQMNRERGTTIIITSHDMDDLMEMAGRIIMLDRGNIAYDGGFDALREMVGGQRTLILTTASELPPLLPQAVYDHSQGNRHWYKIDTCSTTIISLLQGLPQHLVVDIETQNPPLEEQIADLYQLWSAEAVQ